MEVTIAQEIREEPRLAAAVDRATRLLGVEAPPSGARARADWSIVPSSLGPPRIRLELRDPWDGDAAIRFSPEELDDPERLQFRIFQIWSQLLQDRSHKQIRALSTAASEGDGE